MTTMPESPPLLHAALQAELMRLIAEPLTAKSLRRIEETAKLARMLLSIGKVPDLPPKHGFIPPGGMALDDGEDDGYVGAPGYDAPLAPAPKAETFAATLIREAVSVYADMMNRPKPVSPVEAVLAIKYARESGMHKLADKLEGEIAEHGIGSVVAEGMVVPTVLDPKVVKMKTEEYLLKADEDRKADAAVISPPSRTQRPEAVSEVVQAAVDAYLAKADEDRKGAADDPPPHVKKAAAETQNFLTNLSNAVHK